jgi:hypothetical protein
MAYIGKSPSSGIRNRFIYTATAGQTTFSGSDDHSRTLSYTDAEFMDVFLNGVKLDKSDYTATSGTSVVLDEGAAVDDILEVLAFDTFSVFSGEFSQDVTVGGTLTANGNVDVNGNELILDADGDTSITADTDDQIDFKTAGNDRVSINSTGNVIVKSGSELHLNRADNARSMNLYTDNDYGTIETSTDPIKINAKSGRIQFEINGSETARITSDGLTFNGDTATANALDDYEEGTWTPTFYRGGSNFSTTPTYSTREGTYTKIGDFVHVSCEVRFNNNFSGGSGNYLVSGLPFSAENQLDGISWGLMTAFSNTWTFGATFAYISGTTVTFGSGMTIASSTNSQYLCFSGHYKVA